MKQIRKDSERKQGPIHIILQKVTKENHNLIMTSNNILSVRSTLRLLWSIHHYYLIISSINIEVEKNPINRTGRVFN